MPHETRVLEGGNVTHPWNRYLVADDDSDNFGYETAIVRAPTSSLASEVAGRRALIYQPSKDALTSGRQQTKHWTLKFDHKEYWSSPLMGYMSAADTTTQLTPRLRFESAEEAVLFCRRNGECRARVVVPRRITRIADFCEPARRVGLRGAADAPAREYGR